MISGTPKFTWNSESGYRLAGTLVFYIVWVLWHADKPFFWDTILHSRAAGWYLESNFSSLVLPQGLDAGHTPGFNLYLAVCWKAFGRSLWVSHLAMLPMVLGAAASFFLVVKRILPAKAVPFALVLFFLEPAWLTQTTLVSADLGLVCFFFLALHLILSGQRKWLVLALIGLAFVTFRGIFAVAALGLIDVFGKGKLDLKGIPNKVLAYLPAILLVAIWLFWHWQQAGWLLAPPAETYGEHRQFLGFGGMGKNIAVIGWRFLDQGRAWLWLFFIGTMLFGMWKTWASDQEFRRLLRVFLIPTLLFSLIFFPFSNPIGTRYFMVSFLLFSLLISWALARLSSVKMQRTFLVLLVLGLFSGHFWIYPDQISKSWDTTLSHTPYFAQREAMASFIKAQKIPRNKVCTDFPNINGFRFTDLKVEDASFRSKYELNLDPCEYIWYSNIFNGFSDQELSELNDKKKFHLIKKIGNWPVRMELYQSN